MHLDGPTGRVAKLRYRPVGGLERTALKSRRFEGLLAVEPVFGEPSNGCLSRPSLRVQVHSEVFLGEHEHWPSRFTEPLRGETK